MRSFLFILAVALVWFPAWQHTRLGKYLVRWWGVTPVVMVSVGLAILVTMTLTGQDPRWARYTDDCDNYPAGCGSGY